MCAYMREKMSAAVGIAEGLEPLLARLLGSFR
jgi:hypothetical protein